MDNLSKKVGKRIRQIRELKGIKQCDLAEQLNMEPSNLTRIENGYQFPKEKNLSKIADILGVEVKELFEFPEELEKAQMTNKIIEIFKELSEKELEFLYKFIKLYKFSK